jgi:hypothetical protein
MKRISLAILGFIISAGPLYAQSNAMTEAQQKVRDSIRTADPDKDSARIAYLDKAALAYPIFRQGALSTEFIGQGNTSADLFGNRLYKGKVDLTREKANVNIPISRWGKNSLVGSFSYLDQHYNVSQVQAYNPDFPIRNMDFTKPTFGFSVTYTRHDSLFNRPVVYNLTPGIFSDQLSTVRKLNFIGSALFELKRTANDALLVGFAVIADPSSPIPVVPVVFYWHKFGQSHTELFVDLPTRVQLRSQLSKNSWLAFGSDLTNNFAFYSLNQPLLPQHVSYTSIELKTGPSYEYRLSKKIILGAYGGLFSTLDSRLFKGNDNWNNYIVRNHNSSVPFVNFTISFLPFLKPAF